MNVATYNVRATFIHKGSLMGHTSVNVDFTLGKPTSSKQNVWTLRGLEIAA